MKNNRTASTLSFGLSLGVAAGLLASVSLSAADTTVTTKTTTYSGVVSEINPASSTIILKSESAAAPVTYTYTKETTFVDATGKVVSYETIANSPVRVEYSTQGGQTIVSRVVQTAPSVVVTPPVVAPPVATIREKTTTHTETR